MRTPMTWKWSVFLAIVVLGWIGAAQYFGGREGARMTAADQAALPYLKAANYVPPEGCPSKWDGVSNLPLACASPHYRIQTGEVADQFGLPPHPHGEGTLGWFRVGNDALDMWCVDLCGVSHAIPNVFPNGTSRWAQTP